MAMGRAAWAWFGVILTILVSIIIAKSQQDSQGPYGWVLKDPHVLPALWSVAGLLALIGIGQQRWAKRVYWKTFIWLFPPDGALAVNKERNNSKTDAHEGPVLYSELPTFQNTRKQFMELSFSQKWALKQVLQSPGQRYPDLLASLAAMGFAHPDLDVGQLFSRSLAEEQTNGSIAPSVWVVKFQARLFKEFPLDADTGEKHATKGILSDDAKNQKLVIQKARYGPQNLSAFEDVTHIVRAHLKNNAIDIEVSDKTFPEFFPHSRLVGMAFPSKYLLEVVYTIGDLKDQVIVRYSGDRLVLPEASLEPPASAKEAL
jgi:hypothetical protein